jgi:uncharacterized protein
MFGRDWATSPRRYAVLAERDVRIPLPDGTILVGDVFRPDTSEPVPVIAGFHPYNNEFQTGPIRPEGFSIQRGWIEAGDPYFFARRGYAHGIFNVRGTGKSTGLYQAMGPLEAADVAHAVGWLAERPWCTGTVGLFGISYFAWLQIQVAMLAPVARGDLRAVRRDRLLPRLPLPRRDLLVAVPGPLEGQVRRATLRKLVPRTARRRRLPGGDPGRPG